MDSFIFELFGYLCYNNMNKEFSKIKIMSPIDQLPIADEIEKGAKRILDYMYKKKSPELYEKRVAQVKKYADPRYGEDLKLSDEDSEYKKRFEGWERKDFVELLRVMEEKEASYIEEMDLAKSGIREVVVETLKPEERAA